MTGPDRDASAVARRLRADVSYLASPDLDGRVPGTEGHHLAAEYIEAQMEQIQLEPLFTTGYGQSIRGPGGGRGKNLCGDLPGKTDRRILIGAHYDHIRGCPGADDNAAAVACALEVARRLKPWSGQAHVVFAFFDQEEPPHFQTSTMGSGQFVQDCPFALDDLDCAIVMDLCGHAVPYGQCPEALFAMGAENQQCLTDAVTALSTDRLTLLPVPHDIAPDLSDHHAFRVAGAPFLFLTCGRWQHYHSPTDTVDVLDFPKMVHIVDTLERLVHHIDANPMTALERATPARDFDVRAVESFRRLTGQTVPADRGTIVWAARAWLASVGG